VSDSVPIEQKGRGRPRSEKARRAILNAAIELLLAQGLDAVSMDEVADHAGVSKATIYRWWPTKETLALDALYHEWDTFRPSLPDTGSLRGDLLALIRPWVRRARKRPYARVVAALIEETHTDPEFAKLYHERFVTPRRAPAGAVLERAIERGEIAADSDVELTLDLIYGALFHRLLHGHAPLDNRFVEDVVDATLATLAPSRPGSAAASNPPPRPAPAVASPRPRRSTPARPSEPSSPVRRRPA
jgi:AcrR family transcriptional regulator